MTDDDLDLLRAIRPDPQPDAAVIDRHRRQLQRTMTGNVGGPGRPPTGGQAADDSYDPVRSTLKPSPRRWAAALVGAAALVLGAVGVWAIAGDDDSKVATGTTGSGPARSDGRSMPSSKIEAAPSPACGTEIPASFEVPGALSGPTPVPAEQAEPAAVPGQVILRWERPAGSVEVRWPAAAGPDYDFDEQGSAREPTGGVIDHRLNLDPPDELVVDVNGHEPPSVGCTVIEVKVVGPDDLLRVGVNLSSLFTPPERGNSSPPLFVDLEALVTDRKEVDAAPRDAIECRSSGGGDPIPNRSGDGTSDAWPEPVDALRQFVATPEADGLGDGGFTELVEADGAITYATPYDDDGDGWVVLISVVAADGGWIVDGWRSSGC